MASEVADLLHQAAHVLARLSEVDLDGVDGDTLSQAVLATQRLRGRLDVADARILARWDADGAWRASGAKTPAAWLSWRLHLPTAVARQRVRHARAVRTLPALEEAWAAGDLDRSHVTTLLRARTPRTRDAFAQQHPELVAKARALSFRRFKEACDQFELVEDPDGAEQRAEEGRAAREVHLSQSYAGMWFGRATFDPISGEIVATTLRLIERELFDADWAEAKTRLGRDPLIVDLARTPAQRRADALVEMATRARTAPRDGRRPAPLFTVVVGLPMLTRSLLQLFDRTTITPGSAAPWLTEADVERVVFDSPSRVIDVGARRRLFTGALRRAIEVRDRTCFHPSCDDPPERPQVDHIHEAAKGGLTTQDNGRLACSFHNRWRNHHPDDPDDADDPAPSPG